MADVSVSGGQVRTPVGDAPVIPLILLGTGMYLAWFGVHYFEKTQGPDKKTLWPSDPVKAALTGQALQVSGTTTDAELTAAFAGTGTTPAGGAAGAAAGGPTWSHAQLVTLWTTNGGAQSSSAIAAAIAEAESSGNAKVTSANPDGGTNVGLWQLDTPGGKGAGYTVAQLQDPDTNARVAIMGSANGTDWSAWATYTSGAYLKYMT